MNRLLLKIFFQKMQQVLKQICHFRNWAAIISASKLIHTQGLKKSQNLKKKNQFQIKGLISYSEEASSKNREQNLNAQGAEKISTTMANCQKVKSSFSFCKQLNYEVWKEIIHFWHWAVISSHPDTRN